MTLWALAGRGLRHHWRAHLGVLLGALLSTAILAGALAVGDSVRYSLRAMALARLGEISLALSSGDRFFRAALADELSAPVGAPVVPAMLLRGSAVVNGGQGRVGRVQVAGVPEAFWRLGGVEPLLGTDGDVIVLNERLGHKLGVKPGDEVLLRVEKPSKLSRDAPLSKTEDDSVSIRLTVAALAAETQFGRFSLEANQIPPHTAFVPLGRLQSALQLPGRANTLLVGQGQRPIDVGELADTMRFTFRLEDGGLELRTLPGGQHELRTDRVFLDPGVGKAAIRAGQGGHGVLTYFVNELRLGSRATPYSMVAALDGPPAPLDLRDDEIALNAWEAEDLQARVGDTVQVRYFVVGPMRRLVEESRSFRVRAVLPLAGAAADRNLMPEFPGVSDAENCRDWEPGIPIDLKKIRDKDEKYWDAYRGVPKAFVTLAAGQRMWNNRFGDLTAVRYPRRHDPQQLAGEIRRAILPGWFGLTFVPVREQALAASAQALDFGQLFLGFSFFLVVAALLLAALLFAFGAEQRAEETGVLLALGLTVKQVRRLLLLEGAGLALIAAVLGGVIGVWYTRAVIGGLSTVWRGAVADAALRYHAEPATLAAGAAAGFVVSLLSIWLVVRKQAQVPARELLAEGRETELRGRPAGKTVGLRTAVSTGVLGLILVGAGIAGPHENAAGTFFGAGGLLLIAGIAICRMLIGWLERRIGERELTLGSLGMRNSVRRRGRSLAAVGLLACGSFLVVSIGASRHDPHEGAEKRSSGTGGFALYGESSLPVYEDLNGPAGREAYGLDEQELSGARVLPMRLREGDEASCLNLNRAQVPRVLGVDPKTLRELRAFTFVSTVKGTPKSDPWAVLAREEAEETLIPAVGDVNTVTWSLGKSLGDTISLPDDRGRTVRLRIVGVLAASILQGGLLISEDRFIRHFPSHGGYRAFLVDAPGERTAAVNKELSYGLQDVGLDLTPATERLEAFNAVENTYLSIFAVLGGLGLLLGSVGLGVIVLRNVLERRGELALLRAVGFRSRALQWLVFSEHSLLLALGLAVGVITAVVAVLPALLSPGAQVPFGSLAATIAAVLVSGIIWTWGAAVLALRGPLITALRNE